MAQHIHIHLHRATKDNAAHDPKNGQFTSGSGGGVGKNSKSAAPATSAQKPMSNALAASMHDITRLHADNHRDDGEDDTADLIEGAAQKAHKGQPLTREEHDHLAGLMHEARKMSNGRQVTIFESILNHLGPRPAK